MNRAPARESSSMKAPVAQSVERLTRNQRRAGSSPARGPRESSLARLKRERPEMFKRGYFLEPVLRWWPDWRSQTDPRELDIGHSQRMTAVRERDIQSDDAYTRSRARGDLGGFPIRRFSHRGGV